MCLTMQSSMNTRPIFAVVANSASVNFVFWNANTGLPNASRCFVYAMVSASAASIAAAATTAKIGRVFIDDCIVKHIRGELDIPTASMAKYWLTEQQFRVADECLQLYGGYGYMTEYPIATMFTDARVQQIYGGTNEIMKEIISRFL